VSILVLLYYIMEIYQCYIVLFYESTSVLYYLLYN